MRNRFIIFVLALCMIVTSSMTAVADSDSNVNLDRRYMSDYSTRTDIPNSSFNAGHFSVQLITDSIEWLGLSGEKSGAVSFKSDAGIFNIAEQLPNLKTFIIAELIGRTAICGYTFTCRNIGTADENAGIYSWTTLRNDPLGRIKTALTALGGYVDAGECDLRLDTIEGNWFDNLLVIPAGTTIQYGDKVLRFDDYCRIDELYDPMNKENYYGSTFAENIYKLKVETTLENADDSKIYIHIPKSSGVGRACLQLDPLRYTLKDDIDITISGYDGDLADPLSTLETALNTANNTNEAYTDKAGNKKDPWIIDRYEDLAGTKYGTHNYYIYECDADAVFSSGFAFLNEMLGILAQPGTRITVGPGEPDTEEITINEPDENAAVCAELIISSAKTVCQHTNTEVRDAVAATVTTVGYSGDVYCKDCGILISEGTLVGKLPSSIKLNKTTVNMKTGKTDSTVKVTFVSGDRIKSVTSSDTKLVKAEKSGSNGIKLTTFKKTGTATVTVKLAGGKSAKLTVKVTSAPCTKLTIKNGTKVTLKKGKTHTIKAVRSPSACVQKITYKSSNTKVATVSSKGKIKAKKKGTSKITVKCGTKKKTIKVTVE